MANLLNPPIELIATDFLSDNLLDPTFNDLFPYLGPVIDHALGDPPSMENYPLDALIGEIGLQYHDQEAVAAYFNKFIKPIVGTAPAIALAFDLLGIDASISEWYAQDVPTAPFLFVITLNTLPTNFDMNAMLDLIFALKNERSWPTAIRMAECSTNLVWDIGSFDTEPMDASEGFLTTEGYTLCLYEYFTPETASTSMNQYIEFTGIYAQAYSMNEAMRWDYADLDDSWNEFWDVTSEGRESVTERYYTYTLPGSSCLLPLDNPLYPSTNPSTYADGVVSGWPFFVSPDYTYAGTIQNFGGSLTPICTDLSFTFFLADDQGNPISYDYSEIVADPTQAYCPSVLTGITLTWTGTCESQLVWSDWGTLDDGTGSMVEYTDYGPVQTWDGTCILDDFNVTTFPVTQLFFETHSELVDISSMSETLMTLVSSTCYIGGWPLFLGPGLSSGVYEESEVTRASPLSWPLFMSGGSPVGPVRLPLIYENHRTVDPWVDFSDSSMSWMAGAIF